MKAVLLFAVAVAGFGQTFEQRGFLETGITGYPQTAPDDSGRIIVDSLLRYEATWRPQPWLKLTAGIDAGIDTHRQFDRDLALDVEDRGAQRPSLSLRRVSALIHKGNVTIEAGRQFVRWGKTDLLTPTDRFAPKDFLSVANSDFLSIPAVRATYDNGTDTIDLVWQLRFTPSRVPLLDQRWTVIPPQADGFAIVDGGARYPGGTEQGIRWNHNARGFEYALTFYNGFNHLPLFDAELGVKGSQAAIDVIRCYPELRQYGASTAIPLRWFTLKAEAAYYQTNNSKMDEFTLYVVQLERVVKEWTFVGGYAGEVVERNAENPLLFSPDRGLAKAFLGRASYNWDANTTLSFDAAVRQTGAGSLVRFEYSRAIGQHWRATAGLSWVRGDASDFLGEYHRNSSGRLALRYSF
ncbi:MAG TPA: hypothetical protein VGL53_06165 [Bryobacteraceae bacterium]|jgi:hypothetical protein